MNDDYVMIRKKKVVPCFMAIFYLSQNSLETQEKHENSLSDFERVPPKYKSDKVKNKLFLRNMIARTLTESGVLTS
jgi:hypothetical protein